MPTLNINGNILTDTVANWTVNATVYSGKTILVSTDVTYTGTDQRKWKLANGTDTWANLDYMSIGVNYKSYVALLAQTGVNAPTAKLMSNSIGGTPVWSYFAVGRYRLTITGLFTADKTAIFLGHSDQSSQMIAYWIDADTIEVITGNFVPANVNDVLYDSSIEIRVYQ